MANEFDPRRAPDDLKSVSYTDAAGTTHELHPSDGLLKPTTPEADAVLESLGYAHVERPKATKKRTSKAKAASKAKTTPAASAPAKEPDQLPETKGSD